MPEKYFYVYKITNLLNGKIYIGKSKYRPYYESYYGSGLIIEAAIKKYGKENFKKEILEEFETEEEAFEAEALYIQQYNSTNSEIGYNIDKGGPGGRSWAFPYEGRKKTDLKNTRDEINTVPFNSQEYRDKQAKITKQKWAEDRESRMAAIKAANYWTPERRAEKAKAMNLMKENPEWRKKIGDAVKKSVNDEYHAHLSEAVKKFQASDEYKKKRKAYTSSPWAIEFNKKVMQPLSTISRNLKLGNITEEEANIQREKIKVIKQELEKSKPNYGESNANS